MVVFTAVIIGLAFGSFANVCIYRSHADESLLLNSRCPHCGREISWHDLIPLVSFLLLGGQCRHCQRSISWQYPFVEMLCGGIFGLAEMEFGLAPTFFYYSGIMVFFVIIAVGDWVYHEINDWHVIGALFWTLGWKMFLGGFGDALAGGGLGLFFSMMIYCFARWRYDSEAFGAGDVTLSAMIGTVVGWTALLPVYAVALGLHVVFAMILMGIRGVSHANGPIRFNVMIPFGPPLVLAVILFPVLREFIRL